MTKLLNVLIAVDQLANTVLAGTPDETLSSRAYRCGVIATSPKRRWVITHAVVNKLFFWQHEHCKKAYESERNRSHLVRGFTQ